MSITIKGVALQFKDEKGAYHSVNLVADPIGREVLEARDDAVDAATQASAALNALIEGIASGDFKGEPGPPGPPGPSGSYAVTYVEQTLTEEQKAQALENLGLHNIEPKLPFQLILNEDGSLTLDYTEESET